MSKYPIPVTTWGEKCTRSFVCIGCKREHALLACSTRFNCICGASTDVTNVVGWVPLSDYSEDVKPMRFGFVIGKDLAK